ncbi:MAG: arylsulfotransferase family protein, partial [bacterium]
FWRRAQLLENGDVIVIFSGSGIIKLDKDSNIIWTVFNHAHHDFYIANNNNIYVLTREAHINKKYNEKKPILEDYICILDQNGKQLKKISILEAIEKSKFSPILNRLESWGDITHANTIEIIERNTSIPAFTKGRILVSLLSLDLVCLIDIDKGVVWAESDLWSRQHESTLLKNDHIMVLDNSGIKEKSRIIEFHPITKKFYWVYGGKKSEPFNTPSCGSCQRLSNGNTLITETDAGRAFEVSPDKTIVWEYINPHRAGENEEYIASLHEVTRMKPDFPLHWLPSK